MGASHYLGVEHATHTAGASSATNSDVSDEDERKNAVDLDAYYGDARVAYEITAATFDRMVAAHRVLLVNFHAPWCSHCASLKPVFEHAADLVRQDLKTSGTARLARRARHRGLHARRQRAPLRGTARAGVPQPRALPRRRAFRARRRRPGRVANGGASSSSRRTTARERASSIAALVREALDETLAEADARHESAYDDDEGRARAAAA